MTAITHQKHDEKEAVFALLGEHVDSLDADERRGLALALAQTLMARMTLEDLRDWRKGLESNKARREGRLG